MENITSLLGDGGGRNTGRAVSLGSSSFSKLFDDANTRDAFSRATLALADTGFPNHTVVVINPSSRQTSGWEEIGVSILDYGLQQFKHRINACHRDRSGETLRNLGDGGYANWAMRLV